MYVRIGYSQQIFIIGKTEYHFIFMFRSDTPSPPNSSRYLNLKENGQKMKITQSYILKPRQVRF